MQKLSDYDLMGPVIEPVEMDFFTRIDPNGLGVDVEFPFRKTVYSIPEMTAQMVLSHRDGGKISSGPEMNDYYGFGDCLALAIGQAEVEQVKLKGALDVSVFVDIETRRAVLADVEPFYHGAVRGIYVPYNWRFMAEGPDGKMEECCLPRTREERVCIWKNGEKLTEFDEIMTRIRQAIDGDVAGSLRKGGLRVSEKFLALEQAHLSAEKPAVEPT